MNNAELIQKINLALEDIRPYLKDDGGDIELIEVTDDLIVKVKFLGACQSCNMNLSTLKGGVEASIKKTLPEIKEVIMVEETVSL